MDFAGNLGLGGKRKNWLENWVFGSNRVLARKLGSVDLKFITSAMSYFLGEMEYRPTYSRMHRLLVIFQPQPFNWWTVFLLNLNNSKLYIEKRRPTLIEVNKYGEGVGLLFPCTFFAYQIYHLRPSIVPIYIQSMSFRSNGY